MPRGGARPGAGRKRKNPLPDAKPVAEKPTAVAPGGVKPPGAEAWPFGTEPEAAAEPAESPEEDVDPTLSPLDYLLQVMRGQRKADKDRMAAAQLAAPYMHAKKGEAGGKKGEAADKAKAAGSGKFAAAAPPRLVHSSR